MFKKHNPLAGPESFFKIIEVVELARTLLVIVVIVTSNRKKLLSEVVKKALLSVNSKVLIPLENLQLFQQI